MVEPVFYLDASKQQHTVKLCYTTITAKLGLAHFQTIVITPELLDEKTCFPLMQKQRRRSAVQQEHLCFCVTDVQSILNLISSSKFQPSAMPVQAALC